MQTFSTLLVASAILGAATSTPLSLYARDMCGAAPTATTPQTVLSQPTDAKTAEQCRADCDANASCKSFVFGFVNGQIECMLYSVAAANVPTQSSTNLLAYDKACANIPTATPSASNPTGANNGGSSNTNGGSSNTNGNNGNNNNNNNNNNGQTSGQTNGQTGSNNANNANNAANHARVATRSTCGGAPAGRTGNSQPMSTISGVTSAADCLARCKQNTNCKSAEFGRLTANGAETCRLFNVAAASVPAPSNGQSFTVYDVGC